MVDVQVDFTGSDQRAHRSSRDMDGTAVYPEEVRFDIDHYLRVRLLY